MHERYCQNELKIRHDYSSKLVAELKKGISNLGGETPEEQKGERCPQQELGNTKQMDLPFEKREIQALASVLQRLKGNQLDKSWFVEAIPTEKTSV